MIPNQFPSLNFDLGETADLLRDSVHSFSDDHIAPRAEEIDKSNEFPTDLWPLMGQIGLHGITVSEEFGGSGLGYLEHCVAMEEVSRASASVGLSYGAHSNLCVNQISRNGTDKQKNMYLRRLKYHLERPVGPWTFRIQLSRRLLRQHLLSSQKMGFVLKRCVKFLLVPGEVSEVSLMGHAILFYIFCVETHFRNKVKTIQFCHSHWV